MILAELKKTLFGHKGIIVILLLLIYNAYWLYSTNEIFIEDEGYKETRKCYEKYEGKIDRELIETVKRDYEIVGPGENIGAAYRQFISEAGEQLATKEEPYVVYRWGWIALIYNPRTNTPLITFGLIFSVIIFALDSDSKVRNLLNTSYLGRRNLIFSRFAVYSGLSLLFVLMQGILEFVMADRLIGVGCLRAPIQSIIESSPMNISLIGTYVLTMLLKLLGLLMGGIIICFISSMLRSMYLSAIVSVMVFMEYYFFSYLYEKPFLLPQHLFCGYKYFEGTDIRKTLIVTFVIMILAIAGIYVFNSEKSRRKLV